MEVHAIRTEAAYRAMLARVSNLIDLDPLPGSPEGEELEVLGTLVQAYEEQHWPISPSATIKSDQILYGSGGPYGSRP